MTLAPLGDTSATASNSPAAPPLATAVTPVTVTTNKPAASGAAAHPSTTATAAPATPSAQAQLRQCCADIRKQAKVNAAQAAQLNQAATLCDGLVAAMGNAPTMPQFDGVKAMLGGVALPPVCQGL